MHIWENEAEELVRDSEQWKVSGTGYSEWCQCDIHQEKAQIPFGSGAEVRACSLTAILLWVSAVWDSTRAALALHGCTKGSQQSGVGCCVCPAVCCQAAGSMHQPALLQLSFSQPLVLPSAGIESVFLLVLCFGFSMRILWQTCECFKSSVPQFPPVCQWGGAQDPRGSSARTADPKWPEGYCRAQNIMASV